MIDYRLDDLGWFEFEQLIQTVAKARLGFGIEAWGGRGDWGRDAYFKGKLRYPTKRETDGAFVFQAKFVECANAAGAKPDRLISAAVQKECAKIEKNLKGGTWDEEPVCYALFTNASVTPTLRDSLCADIKAVLPNAHCSVHDGHDVCQWLRLSPEIVRSFPQLLSLRDLQELLRETVNAEIIVRSRSAIALAQSYSRVFVPTDSYYVAREKLQQYGFVVLEGPPEMGKTTIGRVIALSQIFSGWEALECRSPAEVLKVYRADIRQVFVADDFFGRTEYEPIRVSEWQAELAHIIPLLDHFHWLVLTCRAHLLEMAKADLDISGQNHRFPTLGEVVVDAGKLKFGEKARMLYRHAKAFGLTQAGKDLVRSNASTVVKHPHFTPERIRRLIEELVPKLALKEESAQVVKNQIAEALSNPTKQMRVTFRKLPVCHRWLLFALLEADHVSAMSTALGGSAPGLQKRYESLCPADEQQPFSKVLTELTEAFVKKSPSLFTAEIGWIHPSCRDLAIEELAQSRRDKHRFLLHCSEAGLFLATSLAGGATGARQLPLLETDVDWTDFSSRAKELIAERTNVLRVIWFNYEQIKKQSSEDSKLTQPLQRLRTIIEDVLVEVSAQRVGSFAYSNSDSLRTFYQICQELRVTPSIDLAEAWAECMEDVGRWLNDRYVIWQDERVPGTVFDFVRTLLDFHPAELQKPEVRERLQELVNDLLERAGEERDSDYEKPDDDDERRERADAFEKVGKSFKKLSKLPLWNKQAKADLKAAAGHFAYEADNLREELPGEPDYDGESQSDRPSGEDVNIDELFSDL
jgi:hypothetical protein